MAFHSRRCQPPGEATRVVQIGSATLYLGDCFEIMPTLKAEAVVTDPPFGIGFKFRSYDDAPKRYDELMASSSRWRPNWRMAVLASCGRVF